MNMASRLDLAIGGAGTEQTAKNREREGREVGRREERMISQ